MQRSYLSCKRRARIAEIVLLASILALGAMTWL